MKAKPKILGVCSSIANQYDIDVLLLRIIVLMAILSSFGTGLFLYLITSFLIEDEYD
jgi:phage shock protein PspC (stress-responsive transcriptional regulator)